MRVGKWAKWRTYIERWPNELRKWVLSNGCCLEVYTCQRIKGHYQDLPTGGFWTPLLSSDQGYLYIDTLEGRSWYGPGIYMVKGLRTSCVKPGVEQWKAVHN